VPESAVVEPVDPAQLRRRVQDDLARLEQAGAAGFDEPGVHLVHGLLERARTLEEPARRRLEARAAERLASLEASFERERGRAREELEALSEGSPEAAPELSEAWEDLEGGRLDRALRLARRRRARAPAASARLAQDEQVARRSREYRDALADLTASISRAQARDEAVEQAGLLNGRVMSARLLEEAEAISPDYRRALVADLVDLAALLHLPELPAPRKRR